jgi:hypothetical protein
LNHSVIAITFMLPRSDPIKRRTLYLDLWFRIQYFLHIRGRYIYEEIETHVYPHIQLMANLD